jgi:hypothetical protein
MGGYHVPERPVRHKRRLQQARDVRSQRGQPHLRLRRRLQWDNLRYPGVVQRYLTDNTCCQLHCGVFRGQSGQPKSVSGHLRPWVPVERYAGDPGHLWAERQVAGRLNV